MAEETLIVKVERLEAELKNANELNQEYKELLKKARIVIQKLKNENEELKNDKNIIKVHNERRAGRHKKFTDKQIEKIKQYRANGNTIKELAKKFNCSVGLIHKLINE